MNCPYSEKTILYFYGELPAGGAAELKAHLDGCSSCAADLAALKSLSEGFEVFKPSPPPLDIEALSAGSRRSAAERLTAGFMRLAPAGAMAAVFLVAFHLSNRGSVPSGWQSDIDAGLADIEGRIYTLEDEMAYSPSVDFDYEYSDLETRKKQADGWA